MLGKVEHGYGASIPGIKLFLSYRPFEKRAVYPPYFCAPFTNIMDPKWGRTQDTEFLSTGVVAQMAGSQHTKR